LLVARKQLQGKLLDIEFSIRGILRGFGLKMSVVTRTGFEARVRELCAGQAMLEQIAEAMLAGGPPCARNIRSCTRQCWRSCDGTTFVGG
jgi:hypothetical protein